MMRFAVWLGTVIAVWQLYPTGWGITIVAVLLGRGLRLYRLADFKLALKSMMKMLTFKLKVDTEKPVNDIK